MALIVFPIILVGVWLLLLVTLRGVPLWFFVGAVVVAGVLVVMGILDPRSPVDDHAGIWGPVPVGLIHYVVNAVLGLLTALGLACLTFAVEVIKETMQRRSTESASR
jgi:hypothetical protein